MIIVNKTIPGSFEITYNGRVDTLTNIEKVLDLVSAECGFDYTYKRDSEELEEEIERLEIRVKDQEEELETFKKIRNLLQEIIKEIKS